MEGSVKSPTVRVMAAADEDPAVATVVLAFAADPMARWTWPHAHQYLAAMPRMIRAFGGRAFSNGSAFCTDGYAGAALWLSSGVHPDEEALNAVVESTVAPSLSAETAAIFEQMAKYHPTEPHWHLALIGVDPAHQGEGHGDALMAYALAQARSHAGLFEILEPAQHLVLPAPRLRTARRDPGRFVADARPDAAATALSSECENRGDGISALLGVRVARQAETRLQPAQREPSTPVLGRQWRAVFNSGSLRGKITKALMHLGKIGG